MRALCLPFFALLLLLVNTGAQAIVLVAAELPPYVIQSSHGKPSGVGIEIMEEAARRLKEPLTIELMPLPRALTQTIHRPDVLMIPPVRSSQREHLYQWVTPILDEQFLIVSDRRFHPKALKSSDLKNLDVGVLRYSFGQHLLKQRIGIRGETVADEQLNAHKLHRGRIDAWVAAWNVILYAQQQDKRSSQQLVRGEVLMNTQLFLAAHKDFPFKQAQRWQAVIDEMRHDGTLARIIRQYNYQAPE
ncbi:substrate-binding periplasmic protein [Aeromonas veronii]|uniref:substrate-binding periplasmic protein n=1 Tax=Aeromonas TaxID=642 RepID=UPI0022EAE964|nr:MULTISPECIES: transporter substrate-binding domain-containing protein [Aeromonas]KAJ8743073.1 transporter substrate-binding domain-containing protein [Aeromonas veronii]MDA3315138.1 transporter substrate-binding domain-containing protein [Aeromonas sp. PI_26]WOE87129.1 transporter substrate-binding domain-containing protein [Aeromonas veronii]